MHRLEPIMRPRTASLRLISLRLAVPELVMVTRRPGVVVAYQFTVQYHDGRHPDQVATLVKQRASNAATLAIAYRRSDDRPLRLTFEIPNERFTAFEIGLRKLGFDRLEDAPDLPWYGADLWLVERAAGSFHHDVIVAPAEAAGQHAALVELVNAYMAQAVRAAHV